MPLQTRRVLSSELLKTAYHLYTFTCVYYDVTGEGVKDSKGKAFCFIVVW